MRIYPAIVLAPILLTAGPAAQAAAPVGRLLEVHACQLLAGGCVASSEATLGGRTLLRVWQFEAGDFSGADLRGLSVAALHEGDANLAVAATPVRRTVVYVPEDSTAAQAGALAGWVLAQDATIEKSALTIKRVRFATSAVASRERLQIGNAISFSAGELVPCGLRGCGQQLWYEPRSEVSAFVVLTNEDLRVDEPALDLRWQDHGKPSVFLGRFGEPAGLARVRLAAADFCGG